MAGKRKKILLTIAIGIISLFCFCHGQEVGPEEEAGEESVHISAKCAAVIVSGGALGGAGLVYALTPAALCTAGFCPVGVSQSSFASWWQSTMPLVQSGSIFATLQSVAMGGVGTKVVISGSVLGGALGKVRGTSKSQSDFIFCNVCFLK